MLGQPGALARFALAAWDSFDKDLAYIGRLQAAIEAAPGQNGAVTGLTGGQV